METGEEERLIRDRSVKRKDEGKRKEVIFCCYGYYCIP